MSARPTVSVIIPTKNRREALEETVCSLLKQTCPAHELIVVDQGETESILQTGGLPSKYLYDPAITGASQARNEGMKHATGDIWLFLDDDVVLEPDFIEKLLSAYSPNVIGVSGIITNYDLPALMQRAWASIFQLGPFHDDRQRVYRNAGKLRAAEPTRVRQFGAGLMSFRADKIRELWFDENLHGACFGEDIDFCARLPKNGILLITPQARLLHKRTPEGRNQTHWLDLHAQGANYMRQRHYRSGIFNNLSFAWLNFGYALAAAISSVRKMSLEAWRAWCQGAKRGRSLAGVKSAD